MDQWQLCMFSADHFFSDDASRQKRMTMPTWRRNTPSKSVHFTPLHHFPPAALPFVFTLECSMTTDQPMSWILRWPAYLALERDFSDFLWHFIMTIPFMCLQPELVFENSIRAEALKL